ncbi:unnamed protein product [Acanthoscelides obtectus]|uniref:Protein quiver n=1 Tax=Acanthoscelides obtectus TaxID=200917 RepID=A0A9P0LU14_ACAOB|nr:unnamed protein product [Acanthoscelides obtectus]CAK1677938.1 hypothetical protein AOBTE_LOCUS31659 [Acanthoscelides obtectus]
MAAMKVLLFVTVVVSAIAYTQAVKCYACDSKVGGKTCSKAQSEDSNVIDCSRWTPLTGQEYACVRYEYKIGKETNTLRSCVEKSKSCLRMEQESQFPLKNCKVCDKDKCNGH